MGKRTASIASIEVIIASARFRGDTGQPTYCNVPNCARAAKTMSLCRAHYFHYHKHRSETRARPDFKEVLTHAQPYAGLHGLKPRNRYCHIPECKRDDYQARGMCSLHYRRWYNATRKKSNA